MTGKPVPDPFAGKAADWDRNEPRVVLARAVAAALQQHLPLAGMSVMEFGAGTGLVTLLLQPLVRHITAVDASSAMLAQLEGKVAAANLNNVQTVWADGENMPLPRGPFDAAISAMALHHVRDTQKLLKRLHVALRPGGWLGLADLDMEDGSFHHDMTGVFHNGFSRAEFQKQMVAAGFTNVVFHDAWSVRKLGKDGKLRDYPIFLAVARR